MWMFLRQLLSKLDDWSYRNWRWIMFSCQVCISMLTLCFCFGMIGRYKGDAQKSYWPIVTIIIGYFMPNAGNWYEAAKKESLQRAAWAARALERENKKLQQQLAQDTKGQPSTNQSSSTPTTIKPKKLRQSHRTFYVAQVVVALSIMCFCMSQLVSSQQQRFNCMKERETATRAFDTLLALQGSGVNITASTLVGLLAHAVPVTAPPALAPEVSVTPAASNLTLFSGLNSTAQSSAVQLTATATVAAAAQAPFTCNVQPGASWITTLYNDNSTALQQALADVVANPIQCNLTDLTTPCVQCTLTVPPGTYTLAANPAGNSTEEIACIWKCFDSNVAGSTLQILSSNQLELQANTSKVCICTPPQPLRRQLLLLQQAGDAAKPSQLLEPSTATTPAATATATAATPATSRKLLQDPVSSPQPMVETPAPANAGNASACADSTKETEGVYLPIITALNGFFMPKQPDKLGDEDEEEEEEEEQRKENEKKNAEQGAQPAADNDTAQSSDQGPPTAATAAAQ